MCRQQHEVGSLPAYGQLPPPAAPTVCRATVPWAFYLRKALSILLLRGWRINGARVTSSRGAASFVCTTPTSRARRYVSWLAADTCLDQAQRLQILLPDLLCAVVISLFSSFAYLSTPCIFPANGVEAFGVSYLPVFNVACRVLYC